MIWSSFNDLLSLAKEPPWHLPATPQHGNSYFQVTHEHKPWQAHSRCGLGRHLYASCFLKVLLNTVIPKQLALLPSLVETHSQHTQLSYHSA